ncbi:MAG: chromate transporter [Clostridia bacterium]|nr:chromate transporter [Clostridia bacterium]
MSEKSNKFNTYLQLFWSFFKIGALTFGGGAAMISFMSAEAVDKKKWITDEEMLDIVTVAESTPGPIAVNTATFVGYRAAGSLGSVIATLGTVIPPFIIMTFIAAFFDFFKSIEAINYMFMGVRVGVIALILKAFLKMFSSCKKDAFFYIMFALAFCAVAIFGAGTIPVIISAGLIGVGSVLVSLRRDKK